MKILILSNFGMGLYQFRKELIQKLCTTNEVVVALPDSEYSAELIKLGCRFVPLEFNRRGINPVEDIKQFLDYRRLIKELSPDVVLTYTIKPNIYGGLACRVTRTPYIANITGLGTAIENGGWLGFVSVLLYKIGLKKASCVFFQNENNFKLFCSKQIYKGHTRVIPGSGVNLEHHCYSAYPSETKDIRFTFIGRVMRDKGIEELLDAVKMIHADYPHISLDIVGGCDEDYTETLTMDSIKEYVHYHGQQFDVREFITNNHCTVLPSYHEGMANVLLESAAAGRPVISTRVPGCKETYDDGITGFGCDVKSSISLADAMKKFIELPWSEKEQMGLLGHQKMKREFDRNIVIKAYLEEINAVSTSL